MIAVLWVVVRGLAGSLSDVSALFLACFLLTCDVTLLDGGRELCGCLVRSWVVQVAVAVDLVGKRSAKADFSDCGWWKAQGRFGEE